MDTQSVVYTFITSLIALFPVINPIGNGFIVNGTLTDLDDQHRRRAVRKIILNCLAIALGSLLAGQLILMLFGLAVPVIQLGGGILICKTAWEWLYDPNAVSQRKKEFTQDSLDELKNSLFYPMAFPVVIGPGSISVIFTLMARSAVKDNYLMTGLHYLMIALAIALLLGVLYLLLIQGNRIIRRIGPSANMVINKMVAFITFCIGIQIIVQGIGNIFGIKIM